MHARYQAYLSIAKSWLVRVHLKVIKDAPRRDRKTVEAYLSSYSRMRTASCSVDRKRCSVWYESESAWNEERGGPEQD